MDGDGEPMDDVRRWELLREATVVTAMSRLEAAHVIICSDEDGVIHFVQGPYADGVSALADLAELERTSCLPEGARMFIVPLHPPGLDH
ncbi:hypothetical protein F0U44_12865 [Nocardioides humilatus]|uniref:Uncharacterized protein n=1 Tax=Nocardioides humilatus TaxID=2607660 RepID=A0A5B1LIB8_9ACTN|nr:hypothetical protein [Nocardioides humilatus]KAA1419327.1 hypothetical protein F0U44_12865 [Nocardioides humilatus]